MSSNLNSFLGGVDASAQRSAGEVRKLRRVGSRSGPRKSAAGVAEQLQGDAAEISRDEEALDNLEEEVRGMREGIAAAKQQLEDGTDDMAGQILEACGEDRDLQMQVWAGLNDGPAKIKELEGELKRVEGLVKEGKVGEKERRSWDGAKKQFEKRVADLDLEIVSLKSQVGVAQRRAAETTGEKRSLEEEAESLRDEVQTHKNACEVLNRAEQKLMERYNMEEKGRAADKQAYERTLRQKNEEIQRLDDKCKQDLGEFSRALAESDGKLTNLRKERGELNWELLRRGVALQELAEKKDEEVSRLHNEHAKDLSECGRGLIERDEELVTKEGEIRQLDQVLKEREAALRSFREEKEGEVNRLTGELSTLTGRFDVRGERVKELEFELRLAKVDAEAARRNETSTLEALRKKWKTEVGVLRAQYVGELSSSRDQLRSANVDLEKAVQRGDGLDLELALTDADLIQAVEREDALKGEAMGLRRDLASIDAQLQACKGREAGLARQNRLLNDDLADERQQSLRVERQLDEAERNLDTEIAGREADHTLADLDLDSEIHRADGLEAELRQLEEVVDQARGDHKVLRQGLAGTQARLEDSEFRNEVLRGQLEDLETANTVLKQNFRDLGLEVDLREVGNINSRKNAWLERFPGMDCDELIKPQVVMVKVGQGDSIGLAELIALVKGVEDLEVVLGLLLRYVRKGVPQGIVKARSLELLWMHGIHVGEWLEEGSSELESKLYTLLRGGELDMGQELVLCSEGVVMKGRWLWANSLELTRNGLKFVLVCGDERVAINFATLEKVGQLLPGVWRRYREVKEK